MPNHAHLCLSESFWDADIRSATQRFYVIDAQTSEVTRHAMTTEAYTNEQFEELLARAGFRDIRFFPSLVGAEVEEESQSANCVIVGRKGHA